MGANASRNETGKVRSSSSTNSKSKELAKFTSRVAVCGARHRTEEGDQKLGILVYNRKYSSFSAGESAAGEATQKTQHFKQEQQRSRQPSSWSLSSLSGHLNWSFTGAAVRNSFRNQHKNTVRKSFSETQQRRAKTLWHRPLTSAIFSSHFKETSRNEHFHVVRLIAKGAFGVVFQVINKQEESISRRKQQKQLNSDNGEHPQDFTAVYALKVLKKSKVIEQNSVQQIKDEADIQRLCGHHPFLVQQIDLWQNRRNLHILSEYVPNGELFSKITAFSLDLIRLYVAEIALAIDFLHNAGIIYRDAKPENILLTETYHLKLTDFGLSKWLKLGTTTSTMCGTFQYMAPEILRGQPYGHAVDWWSLGIIACQMFTDAYPDVKQFRDATFSLETAAAFTAINFDVPDEPLLQFKANKPLLPGRRSKLLIMDNFLPSAVDSLPHAAKDVIQRLLEFDPKQRLRSVLSLQRIALYRNYKIDSKHLLSISPLDIMARDDIKMCSRTPQDSVAAIDAFDCF